MPHDLKDLVNIDVVQDVLHPRISWVPSPTEEILRQVSQAIALDRDGKIRKALIDLGWTPPVEGA